MRRTKTLRSLSEGVRHVFVNGVHALNDGKPTGQAGRPGAVPAAAHAEPAHEHVRRPGAFHAREPFDHHYAHPGRRGAPRHRVASRQRRGSGRRSRWSNSASCRPRPDGPASPAGCAPQRAPRRRSRPSPSIARIRWPPTRRERSRSSSTTTRTCCAAAVKPSLEHAARDVVADRRLRAERIGPSEDPGRRGRRCPEGSRNLAAGLRPRQRRARRRR